MKKKRIKIYSIIIGIFILIGLILFNYFNNRQIDCGIVSSIESDKVVIQVGPSDDPRVIHIDKPSNETITEGRKICYSVKNEKYSYIFSGDAKKISIIGVITVLIVVLLFVMAFFDVKLFNILSIFLFFAFIVSFNYLIELIWPLNTSIMIGGFFASWIIIISTVLISVKKGK